MNQRWSDLLITQAVGDRVTDEFLSRTLARERQHSGNIPFDPGSQSVAIEMFIAKHMIRSGDGLCQIGEAQTVLRDAFVLFWLQQARSESNLEQRPPERVARSGVVRLTTG